MLLDILSNIILATKSTCDCTKCNERSKGGRGLGSADTAKKI